MLQRFRDIFLLVFLLPVLGPLFLGVLIASIVFHGKEIFFTQMRIGLNQKEFKLFKFRSMEIGAEVKGSGLYSFADDKRVTPFGKFLRRSSLDELPQIFNVLVGDMSFVGPRPCVVGELEKENHIPINTIERFKVKPGLTGWAQIHGRNNLTWPEKIKYDLEYVSFSPIRRFLIDLLIISFTPFYLLNIRATYEKSKFG